MLPPQIDFLDHVPTQRSAKHRVSEIATQSARLLAAMAFSLGAGGKLDGCGRLWAIEVPLGW